MAKRRTHGARAADWCGTLDVNPWGANPCCHHFVPAFRADASGGVINVASAARSAVGPGMAVYNVSKTGVISLCETQGLSA